MPSTDSPVCGIAWKMCTRERWYPDRPYDVVAKGCHVCYVGKVYTAAGFVIILDLHDTLGYE
jgi:hypothetical protein